MSNVQTAPIALLAKTKTPSIPHADIRSLLPHELTVVAGGIDADKICSGAAKGVAVL